MRTISLCLLMGFIFCYRLPAETLEVRYDKLSCAVVQVRFDGGSGTAFFVNSSGRLASVAHVLYDRKYRIVNGQIVAEVMPRTGLSIDFPKGTTTKLMTSAATIEDNRRALFDLAMIETGLATPCFIPFGNSNATKVGQHLISIGFPAGFTSQVLYEGFLSARTARLPLPFGTIEGRPDLAFTPHYEIFRIQMPITPGASGSPVITDANMVVGLISEVPVIMTKDVQKIAETFGELKNVSSGISFSGFDVTKTLGELAWMVSQFESPGSGLAVPVSNLNLPPSATPVTSIPRKPRIFFPKSQ